jgi:flagellar protein FlaG
MINETVKSGLPLQTPVRESVPALSVASTSTAAVKATEPATEATNAAALDPKQLQAAVAKLNDYVQNIRRTLSFSIEESTGRTVIKVY